MALELRQQLKLSQQLVMTPQLQQAIKLLQLSRMELLETVQKELLENPFLEESAEEPALEKAIDSHVDDSSDRYVESMRESADQGGLVTARETGSEVDLRRNADWEDYLGDFSSASKQTQMRESEIPEAMSFEARLTVRPSLDGHLEWQLRLSDFTPKQMEIGEVIIGNLDSSGYLRATLEEIGEMAGAKPEEVEKVLLRVQMFDPIGVAARSPQECLMVQIKACGYDRDPILVSLIRDHLEDLEKKRYKPLCRKFKLTMEDIKEYLDVLQKLDPMPGASFGSGEPHYVSPDVFVYRFGEEYVILLNEDGLPRLELSNSYSDGTRGSSDKDKEYFQEKIRSAVWLMKSLYQRQRTLYKVAESIVKYQKDFFDHGVTKLRPLILKIIAEDIGMHESTVSRITTNKYMATPHGTYELKFFFNSALELDDGSLVGSESVKALIKQLIAEEDSKRPLSDERIAEILKEKLQVNIARRTVAKYRMALDIDSSSKRKEVF